MLLHIIILLLLGSLQAQNIQPLLLLPVETTQNYTTDYALSFYTDTKISSQAYIQVTFPFEFDPRILIMYTQCSYKITSLDKVPCTLTNRTFTLSISSISVGTQTLVIKGIRNPIDAQRSGYFLVATLFKSVVITQNQQFGSVLFSSPPILSTVGQVFNYANSLVEQGSSWVFRLTLSQTYPANSTIRFIFPQGFTSNKVQCNISGIYDPALQTRVLPLLNVYDCLNIKNPLVTSQSIILSGLVNPNYQMVASAIKVLILQPNNMVALEKITMNNTATILKKTMNTTVTIPNNFRNNTVVYIFQININSDLTFGDYIRIVFTGSWKFFIEDSEFLEGVYSSTQAKAYFEPLYYQTLNQSVIFIRNFSSIVKSRQIAFFIRLRTPLTAANYSMTITAFRANGGIAQEYTQTVPINTTSGYIREMRIHPMIQPIKLPVNLTGPIEITLGLRNNLPKTNVLTYGKVVIKISPNLPKPPQNISGVIKCYFYGNIPAQSCNYDDSNPAFTLVTAYTPVDYNFQSSQIPFMITTDGYISADKEGIQIDAQVKRYLFQIQFYTNLSPTVPTQVVFTDWIADFIPFTSFTCKSATKGQNTRDHIKCTLTTPNITLALAGYNHLFRLQFFNSGWDDYLGYTSNEIYPDYPCLMYGTGLLANPYVKCDLITFRSGPHKSNNKNWPYINIYGFQQLPPNTNLTIQIPNLLRRNSYTYTPTIIFSIIEQTWGYDNPYIKLYEQTVTVDDTSFLTSSSQLYTSTSVSYTFSNPIINKVTSFTLNSYNAGVAGVDIVILQLDQTAFPNIGRSAAFTCGTHTCSKFDIPIQQFVLYPSSALPQTFSLTFPSITTPSYATTYTFKMRFYIGRAFVNHISFSVVIQPQQLTACTFQFDPVLETQTVLYPNTIHYHTVNFTTTNPLPSTTSYITITLAGGLNMISQYCVVRATPALVSADTRGVQCLIDTVNNIATIDNFLSVAAGTVFSVILEVRSTNTSSTISPTATVQTFWGVGKAVDYWTSKPHTSSPIANTNLKKFSTFSIANPQILSRGPTAGYFGDLLINLDPVLSSSPSNGNSITLTFTSQFYPYGNVLGLPLSCKINSVKQLCSYTLSPFVVTISNTINTFTSSNNIINITTDYQLLNGIQYPSAQGKYLISVRILNNVSTILQQMEAYIDILPPDVTYFNVTHAHRDNSKYNIYEVEFLNGPTTIPAYNDNVSAGRIYIGFPTKAADNSNVFPLDLGFSGGLGTNIPCHFPPGLNYISNISGTTLQCELHTSPYAPNYAYVEILNFNAIPSNYTFKVIIAKIMNPSSINVDMNFQLKINYINPTTKEQTPLYLTYYNLFIDMLTAATIGVSETNSSTTMFQPGAKVGDANKYINHIPYTSLAFNADDWYIVEMDTQFPYNGAINNCLPNFYKYCIIFPQINWLAIKIGNGTLIPLYVQVTNLPTSISRTNTQFTAYTFLGRRASETITYTIPAASRWKEIMGSISGFSLSVLGSQDKLNINQKNVQVMVSFTVSHAISRGGTIEIKFPSNSTRVPSIKPHCRSVVTQGSSLYGDPTGKPPTNVQGQIGCLVQNTYSWIITSFDAVAANSQIKIRGLIDFPTVLTSSLGTGFVVTYSNYHSTDVFSNARIIDYLSTDFPLRVENKTWSVDNDATMYRSNPLRVSFVGQLELKIRFSQILYGINSVGYLDLNLARTSVMDNSGGFNGPTTNMVCKWETLTSKLPCKVTSVTTSNSRYYSYRIQSYQNLQANTDYYLTLTTQNGNGAEGINFPTVAGSYKITTSIKYHQNISQQTSTLRYIEVYGPKFTSLTVTSTVNMPNQNNMILVVFTPSTTILTNQQFIIHIPTISNDGVSLFNQDLGMGYQDYQDLQFDLYESSITSMACKVYTGDSTSGRPVEIVCSNFNTNILTSHTIKFGFWVKNPSTTVGLSIPVEVYAYNTYTAVKYNWNMIQSCIRVIPTTTTSIVDLGNFASSSTYRQIASTNLQFSTRNTKLMVQNDLYILKFNFDLRVSDKKSLAFKYNSGYANSADAIFMRNCKSVILRVGSTSLNFMASGGTTTNAQIFGVFFNPPFQLNTFQSIITAYAVYLNSAYTEKISYNDLFPSLVPNQPSSPTFTFSPANSHTYKGMREDYEFTFRLSTGSAATDMALVKKIAILFPPYATNDFKFVGTQCMSRPASSVIEVLDCSIDTATNTIWITPVISTAYTNNDILYFETKGLAIVNPVNNVNVYHNSFTIKLYTWSNGDNPVLLFNTDDYVFMKQDATNLPATIANTYTGAYYQQHTYIQVPQKIYTNQFQPATTYASNDIRVKTPLEFKFKVMTAFASLSSGYHQIRLYFATYYTHETINQNSNDLYYYVPTCHLNGYRISSCSISSGKIIMQFQQQLTVGQEVSVRFSVLNTKSQEDDGFRLITMTVGTISLPIEFVASGGSSYYVQVQPFHPAYTPESGGVYPETGVFSASVLWGTQVYNKMNYLQFSLSFSRNDFNGLVLEIPVLNPDGSKIYNNPALMNLPSGSQYPCSVGIGLDVFCYYEQGDTTNYGKPTRIYITKFAIQSGNTLSLRMLFTNPDVIGQFPSFTFKAFGGSFSPPQLMGNQLMGRCTIVDPYKIYPDTGYASTGTGVMQGNRAVWSRQTYYYFYPYVAQSTSTYVILEWTLHHSTYGEIGQYELDSAYINDYFPISYSPTDRRIYLVKKLASSFSGASNAYHTFGKLRQKHFLFNTFYTYLLTKPGYTRITYSLDWTWHYNNYVDSEYGAISLRKVNVQNIQTSSVSWMFMDIDLNNIAALNTLLYSTDPADMILRVYFNSNNMHTSFNGSSYCSIEQGPHSTDRSRPVTCSLNSANNTFIITNFNTFTSQYLKIYYYATLTTSNVGSTSVAVTLYANQDGLNADQWAIFHDQSSAYTMAEIYYAENTGYNSTSNPSINSGGNYATSRLFGNTWVEDGFARITSLSSNSITVELQRSTTQTYSNVYQFTFRFYVERLTFNTVTGVTMSKSGQSNNFRSLNSYGSGDGNFYAIYSFYSSSNTNWPTWSAGESTYFTFTFNSITGVGASSTNPNNLFIHASCTFERTYYGANTPHCGCTTNCNFYDWCCNSGFTYCCCSTRCDANSCRWYLGYQTFILTGKVTSYKTPTQSLLGSSSVTLLSRQYNVQTQIDLQLNNFQVNVGPSYSSFVLLELQSGTYPSGNPFPHTRTSDLGARIDCKCIVGASTSVAYNTGFSQPQCYRYLPAGLQPSIAIYIDIPQSQSLRCFIPGFNTDTSGTTYLTLNAFKLNDNYFHRYLPDAYWQVYATYTIRDTYTSSGGGSSIGVSENSFYSGQVTQGVYYELNTTGPNTANPSIYMSMNAPKPYRDICYSSSFYHCRSYQSFINHKYYLVFQYAGTSWYLNMASNNFALPDSDDYASSYFSTYVGWQYSGGRYYYGTNTFTRSTSAVTPLTSTKSYTPALYGNNLASYPSTFSFTVNLNGRKLYSRFTTNGQQQGSFIRLTLSGFTSLSGCAAVLNNRVRSLTNPFYCEVKSTTVVQILARQDISMGDYLIVTVYTQSIPTSCTYTFELYDKYISGSDYSRTVSTSGSFGRQVTGYTGIGANTLVQFRRTVYKKLQSSSGPIRVILNNNYQYVYDYDTPSLSDRIYIDVPNGVAISYTYICYLKQYPPGQRHLWTHYQTSCSSPTANRISVYSIPSHILSSDYYYEIVIYRNQNNVAMQLAAPTPNNYLMAIYTIFDDSINIGNWDQVVVDKYQSVTPIVLNYIYILTKQAAAVNSLYLNFVVNVAGTVTQKYMEFTFDNLGLSNFRINNGDTIPCYLSGAFPQISGRTISPRCKGYVDGTNNDSPLRIRVMNFGSFSSGTTFDLAFDNFNNPPSQPLFLVPINIMIAFYDETNQKVYKTYFPSVYASDLVGVPESISGTLNQMNSNYGATTYQKINAFSQPYNSNYNDISQKVVMSIQGGMTSATSFNNLYLSDYYDSHSALWTDKIANITVYRALSRSTGNYNQLYIYGITNPYPINRDTYEQLKKIFILYYSSYRNVYRLQLNQVAFSSFSKLSQFYLSSFGPNTDAPYSYSYHSNYPITYDIQFYSSRTSYPGRYLSYTLLTFTAGVSSIAEAYARHISSPYIINPLLQISIDQDSSSNWFLNITGMQDSLYSGNYWYIRVRLYTTGASLSWNSKTYAINQQIQFTASSTRTLSSDGIDNSNDGPTKFQLIEERYLKGLYYLQRDKIYANTGMTTTRLAFRFNAPYQMSETQSFTIQIPSVTELYPTNTPSDLICIIQPTFTTKTSYGVGLHSPCTYSSGIYTFSVPKGGLGIKEYTVSILERNFLTTSLALPSTPKRIQVTLMYTSNVNVIYGDTWILDYSGQMTAFNVNHMSVGSSLYNMIGVTFTPRFTLPAATLTLPATQSVLQFAIESNYFSECLDVDTLYASDGMTFLSGVYFSHFSTPSVTNANTRLQCGQRAYLYPVRLTTTDYGQFTAGTSYYFRYPLIKNPSAAYMPMTYRIRLLSYPTGQDYPTIIGQYDYQNLEHIATSSNSWYYTHVTTSNALVQTSMTVNFQFDSYYPASGTEVLVKWQNDQLKALSSITPMASLSDTNYVYEYYPNINLCLFRKSTANSDKAFTLGTYNTVNQEQSFRVKWIYTYSASTTYYYENPYPGTSNTNSITRRTSWSASTFAKVSGLTNTNSVGVYQISFTTPVILPRGSVITIVISTTFSPTQDYCKSLSGFLQYTNNIITCRKTASDTYIIFGYDTIAANTALSVSLYLRVAAGSITTYTPSASIYCQDWLDNNKYIISANTNTYTLSVSNYGPTTLSIMSYMEREQWDNTNVPLTISFSLSTNTLTTGDYLVLDLGNWTVDTASYASNGGQTIWRYKVGSNVYWVPITAVQLVNNSFRLPVYSSYSMTVSQPITLQVYHLLPMLYNGVKVNNYAWNEMSLFAYKSNGTRVQHEYLNMWVQPYQHSTLAVDPLLKYINQVSPYIFTLTPNTTINANSYLTLQFITSDGYHAQIYANNLGKTFAGGQLSYQMSCREVDSNRVISDSNIKCQLFQGDKTANPPIPATIKIPITKTIPANTAISLSILEIQNPMIASYPIPIVAKLQTLCWRGDDSRPCTLYRSTKYITFVNVATPPSWISTGTFAQLPTIVSAPNSKHTLSASYSVAVGDFLKITYPAEVSVPLQCTVVSGGSCWSYPLQNMMMIKVTSSQSSPYSFAINSFTNLYRYQLNPISTEIYNTNTGLIRARFTTSYTSATISTDPTTSQALSISFTPTKTPNYQLKYSFDNIALIEIKHILQNSQTQLIHIIPPAGITLEVNYCNATMQALPSEKKPYPFRFKCIDLTTSYVKINKISNFPTWEGTYTSRSVFIYLKYTIADSMGASSGNWQVSTYTHATSNTSPYIVSAGSGSFSIDGYMSPYLYGVDFYTQSYSKRTCRTNMKCIFYGYLEPTTDMAVQQISYAVFTLPVEFGYSNIPSYDRCKMKASNADTTTVTCSATRNNSNVMIKYTPTPYNHQYKLITIDHSDSTKLFTTPNYPGDQYQMKVDLYDTLGFLAESQRINVTTVYGYLLNQPDIAISIPMDSSAKGLFDISFKVGAYVIPPSYPPSSSNKVVSQIEIIFANNFAADLGTSLTGGSPVACLPVAGITLNTMGQLKCTIYPSVSTTTRPTIKVTGYDQIAAATIVRFRLAGLQTLAAGITDYIKVGVALVYYNYGNVEGYLYEPTGVVVGPTTAQTTPKAITLSIAQSSSNIVGQLCNYTLSGSIESGFTTVSTTDYVSIQFPEYFFEGQFSMNSRALCSLAASSICFSFGLAKIIYISPSAAISAASFGFTIRNMINSAFNIDYQNRTIIMRTIISNKINAQGAATILKFSKPSPNITGIITSVESLVGGDSNIAYYLQMTTKTNLPTNAIISIQVPNVYTSLLGNSATCTIYGVGKQYCAIRSAYLILIYLNGQTWNSQKAYSLTLTSMTNPNINMTSYKWTITSYFDEDIYRNRIISQSQFSSPQISVQTVKNCTFQVDMNAYNPLYDANYALAFICPAYIKQASQVKIYLSWAPSTTTSKKCQSSTNSIYSYQCNIAEEFQGTTKLTYLSILLREVQPQKLISITTNFPNPNTGLYTLKASISFKGFVYLSSTSNQFYINTQYFTTSNFNVELANYPLNRAQSSIYTFKIANPRTPSMNRLTIALPIQIQQLSTIICNYQSTPKANYIDLILEINNNLLGCSITNRNLEITGLSAISSGLRQDGFMYISIYNIKNPQISSGGSPFGFTFLQSSNVLTSISKIIAYRISPVPLTLQITTFTTSANKLLVLSNYTITMTSTISSILITRTSIIGVIIDFPQQYVNVWSRMPLPSSILLTVGSTSILSISGSVRMVSGKLMANFYFTSTIQFSLLSVMFEFRNPEAPIDCSSTSPYIVSFYDYKFNSILAKTLANNINCPQFINRLYQVNITGNSVIQAGSLQLFTITLEKPAKYLMITPTSISSAITFDPTKIIFQNYTSSRATFAIKASSIQSSNFTITFAKAQQSSTNTFYNDIPAQVIQVVKPFVPYKIYFQQLDLKSVGLPIDLQIHLERSSSTSFTLLYTHNCSTSYTFNPPRNLLIQAGTTKSSIAITYKGDTVPEICSIKFVISTITNNNYILNNGILYISGYISVDKGATIAPLRLYISSKPKTSGDVGRKILLDTDNNKDKLKPVIYKLDSVNIGSNTASFIITTSQPTKIYWAVTKSGTPQTLTPSDIFNQNITTGITYGNTSTTTNINIQATFNVSGLESQKQYLLAAYANSSVGISIITYKVFQTAKSSNGAAFKIALTTIVSNATIIDSISKALRIGQDRISVLTFESQLSYQQSTHILIVMNVRLYMYEIVIAPNIKDETVPPIYLANYLRDNLAMKTTLQTFLPTLQISFPISTRQIILAKPKWRASSTLIVGKVNHQSACISVAFWQQSIVYGIILPSSSTKPLSSQIASGVSNKNEKLMKGYNDSTQTDAKGNGQLCFTLLSDNTSYTIHITAECVLPYTSRLRLSDTQIQSVNVTTAVNLNLKKNKESVVDVLKKIDPVLAEYVRIQMDGIKIKAATQQSTETKKRVTK